MTSLPLWLQVVALVAGLLWPAYQLYLAFFGPKLEVKLTRDLFFRFIDMGECLFIRAVLLAEHGNVLITNIYADLKQIKSGASKEWELEFLKFGELISDNKSVESNFCFSSSSPIRFLSKGLPVQAVYIARAKEYGAAYAQIIKEFGEELVPLRNKASTLVNGSSQPETELYNDVKTLSEKYESKIFDKIQLEEGKYEISLKITYKSSSGVNSYFNRSTRVTKLKFEVEGNAREKVKASLPASVRNAAINKVMNTDQHVEYPQYIPINIKEDVHV